MYDCRQRERVHKMFAYQLYLRSPYMSLISCHNINVKPFLQIPARRIARTTIRLDLAILLFISPQTALPAKSQHMHDTKKNII